MHLRRFFNILLCATLVAAFTLPPVATAKTTTRTTAKTVVHQKGHKKSVKKAVAKTVRKSAKKSSKKAVTKTAKKITKPLIKPIAITGRYVSAAKDGVKVFKNPSPEAEAVWEIFDKFPLLVKKHQGAWLQVTDYEGDTGWIHDSLVTGDRSVIVCKKRINLRQDPNSDTNNPLVAVARQGVVFSPLEKQGDWLKVRYVDGTEGWLNKTLVWPSDPLD